MKKFNGIYEACNYMLESTKIYPNIIVDLGSRHGEGYLLFGKNYPISDYYMVEPSDRCLIKIRELISSQNNKEKIHVIDGVLGNKNCEIDFFQLTEDGDQSGNLFSNRDGKYGQEKIVKVKMVNFSEIFQDKEIDFVKCNIEGGEYDLIEQNFFDNVNMFVMEVHNEHVPGKNYRNAIDLLSEKFILHVWGDVNYKYCFINAIRKDFAERTIPGYKI